MKNFSPQKKGSKERKNNQTKSQIAHIKMDRRDGERWNDRKKEVDTAKQRNIILKL